jgi:signal transduction histidine kinase
MQIDKAFLTSKVARRVFLLFVLCALIPLFVLAGVTFKTVNSQLSDQARKRLSQNCKLKGLEIYNNLISLETELKMFASSAFATGGYALQGDIRAAGTGEMTRFVAMTVLFPNAEKQGLETLFEPTADELDHMKKGRSLIFFRREDKGRPRLFMARLIEPERPQEGIALGEPEPGFLWGIENEGDVIADMPMFVLGAKNEILLSVPHDLNPDRQALRIISDFPVAGAFEYEFEGEPYLAGYWSLFLKYHFFMPGWVIVMSQSQAAVLEPVAYFKKFFFLFTLLTFLVVCLLSVILIRKSMVPIETLRRGTEKIAGGEFGVEVKIRSGDEFETLGSAFNEMSRKLKEGRAMLVQSAKMGAVGQMASGVVHEIGQPLTSLSGLIDILLIKEKEKGGARKRMELMKKEMERLTGIISRFRNFARVSEQTMKPLSINEIVDATFALLAHQIEMKNIDCEIQKGQDLPLILAEKNSLQQVLTNLLINAMDALQEKRQDHSKILVKTLMKDDQVCLEVKDNGPGIPKEIRERIFDPFFTTKGPEKGTGLGLAIIDSILHQHKAKIRLDSESGTGTTFVVSFPRASS